MKHKLGNSPKCYECKYFEEVDDKNLKNDEGYCYCKEYLRTGINGRLIEKPKERAVMLRNWCCKHWIDAESGYTKFEVLTGYKEPYDGTKIDFSKEGGV